MAAISIPIDPRLLPLFTAKVGKAAGAQSWLRIQPPGLKVGDENTRGANGESEHMQTRSAQKESKKEQDRELESLGIDMEALKQLLDEKLSEFDTRLEQNITKS